MKYPLVGCPKYRSKVRVGELAKDLRALLYTKANELEVKMDAVEIIPDPVHRFIESDPSEAPQPLAKEFKGYPSRILRPKYPHLRSRLPSLWSRSYFIGSIGAVCEETVRHSIEMQKLR